MSVVKEGIILGTKKVRVLANIGVIYTQIIKKELRLPEVWNELVDP